MTCVIIDYGSGNLHSAVKSFERAARESGLNTPIQLTNRPEDILAAERIVLPGVGAYRDCLSGLEAIAGLRPALEEAVLHKGRPFFGICVGMQLLSTEGHEHGVTRGLNWIPGRVVEIKPDNPALKIPHMGWNTLNFGASDAHKASAHSFGASDVHIGSAHSFGASDAHIASVHSIGAPDTRTSSASTGAQIDDAAIGCPPATAASLSSDGQSPIHPVLEGIELGPRGLHAYFVHSYHFEVEEAQTLILTTDYGGPITAMVGRDNIIGTQFHPEKSQTLGLKLISNFLGWRP